MCIDTFYPKILGNDLDLPKALYWSTITMQAADRIVVPSDLDRVNNHISDDEHDDFEDATSDEMEKVDLQDAFKDCEIAITKFFCNDVRGAMDLMLPNAGNSLYHSLGAAIFAFIPAILTFDSKLIEKAMAAIKNCINICNNSRRHKGIVETLGSIIKKPNYSQYTDLEAHAELCYAEALLLQAALTVIEGEDLAGLIKGTLKVRTCHNTYKHCWDMMEAKKWESENSRVHFKSGVRLGTATFNLMISMLPAKILAVLEFAGFSGNRYYGIGELYKGSNSPGLRNVLCDLTQLAYNLALQPFVGGQGDYNRSNDILDKSLKKYPDSAWFLVFKARYELLQGNIEEAIKIYKHTSDIGQEGFREFRHLCYWELMWINALIMDFRSSSNYAGHLIAQSAWSRTTYSYVRAVMLIQLGNDSNHSDQLEIRQLLKDAALYKVRIAGKSLPMEKFVIRRCTRYQQQQEKLVLPAIELLCIWNLLPLLKKNITILQKYLKKIEETRDSLVGPKGWMNGLEADNEALLNYMHGCVLQTMDLPMQALQKFQEVVKLKREIKEDHFLVPYAVSEMAMCHYQLEDYEMTMELLTEARKKYSGYSLESRLQFRVHSRMQSLRERLGNISLEAPADSGPRAAPDPTEHL